MMSGYPTVLGSAQRLLPYNSVSQIYCTTPPLPYLRRQEVICLKNSKIIFKNKNAEGRKIQFNISIEEFTM